MKKTCVVLFIFLIEIASLEAAYLVRPYQNEASKYIFLLLSGKFEKIEKDAIESREQNLTISDGQPRLATIYSALAGCEYLGCRFNLGDREWKQKQERLEEWLNKDPSSITAQIGNAFHYVETAWHYRGSGYSNTVDDEALIKFKKYLEIGRNKLNNLSDEAKKDPGWYHAMLQVALHQGWSLEDFNKLFYEAIDLHPTYIPYYFYKDAYMEPKWYGSVELFKEYVDEMVERTRDILGEQLYARLHWSSKDNEMFASGKTDWNRMKKGFEELISKYPDNWNKYNFLIFACTAQDWKKTKELSEVFGDKPITDGWRNSGFYQQCKEIANLAMESTGP